MAPFVRSQRKRKSFTPLSAAPRTEFLREKGTPNAVVWSASARFHTAMIPWGSTVPWLERRLRQPLPARRKEGLALVHARRWTPVSAGTTDGPGPHSTVINIIYGIPQTFHIRQGHACVTDLPIYGFTPLPPPPPGRPVHADPKIKLVVTAGPSCGPTRSRAPTNQVIGSSPPSPVAKVPSHSGSKSHFPHPPWR